MIKVLILPAFIAGMFFGGLVVNQVRYSQLQKCNKEKTQIEEAYRATKLQADECMAEMQRLKVDYQQRLKVFLRALQQRSKYEELKNIKTGEGDECQALKNMLDSYRSVELK